MVFALHCLKRSYRNTFRMEKARRIGIGSVVVPGAMAAKWLVAAEAATDDRTYRYISFAAGTIHGHSARSSNTSPLFQSRSCPPPTKWRMDVSQSKKTS
jgi:hypothetical protein